MTLPPLIRIFFAIDLPVIIKDKLGRFIKRIQKKVKTQGIRWSKPDHLHITLQFLAEIQTVHLPDLLAQVRKQLGPGAESALKLSFGKLQLLPSAHRPRVIVLEIHPQEALSSLSERIGKGIKAAQYEIETRPFKAHLTLGRIKQPERIEIEQLNEIIVPQFGPIEATEIVLFRSEPQRNGSNYSILERIGLG